MTSVLFTWILPIIHVFACVFLVVVVLLQTGKGADMGAVFGGGSQTLFGSGGAGNFLTKMTTGTAIAFMLTSLLLTYGQSREPSSRLLERLPAPAAQDAAPLPPPAANEPATPPVAPQANAEGAAPQTPPPAPAPSAPTPAAPAPAPATP